MFLRVATEGPKMLVEVMPFREIGAKIGIVKRVHIRSRSFFWRRRGYRFRQYHENWQLSRNRVLIHLWTQNPDERTSSGFTSDSTAKFVLVDAGLVRIPNSQVCEASFCNSVLTPMPVVYPMILLITNNTFRQHTKQ